MRNGHRTTVGCDASGGIVQMNTPQGGAAYAPFGLRIIKHSEARGPRIHTLFGWERAPMRNTATDMANAAHPVMIDSLTYLLAPTAN